MCIKVDVDFDVNVFSHLLVKPTLFPYVVQCGLILRFHRANDLLVR